MPVPFLHILSFNIPYPPDYGGVIEVYYKIKALHEAGIRVILHCFEYGRPPSPELDKICHHVYYYKRKKITESFPLISPYIVTSRQSDELLANLSADTYPILFEGLHTCYYINHEKLAGRVKVVRMHNVEWQYYKELGEIEHRLFQKIYFYSEAVKLRHFEKVLKYANYIFAISPDDKTYLERKFDNVVYLPAFHSNERICSVTGKGDYALYHGNLSVGENAEAAKFLAEQLFSHLPFPLVVAGHNPPERLSRLIQSKKNVRLVINPDPSAMEQLIRDAHINILPTFRKSGMKLKLLNALFNGRFCLVNRLMVENTGLEDLCEIAVSPEDFKNRVPLLFNQSFTGEEISRRKAGLEKHFSNRINAEKIMRLIRF